MPDRRSSRPLRRSSRALPFWLCPIAFGLGCRSPVPPLDPAPGPNSTAKPSATPPPATATGGAASRPEQAPPLAPGDIGTAAPSTFIASSPDGRWVAYCQAREDTNSDGDIRVNVGAFGALAGDQLQAYLTVGSGPGATMDRYVGSDPSGRWGALLNNSRLYLLDTWSKTQVDLSALGADLRDDASSYRGHRSVHFDPTGERLLYLRTTEAGLRVVVRQLRTGEELELAQGTGLLWRAQFDASGRWIQLFVVTTDTNKNNRIDWPYQLRKSATNDCHGPVPRYSAWEYPGDRANVRLLPSAGGPPTEAPHFVRAMGNSYLERLASGALVQKGSGPVRERFSERCNARTLHVDAARDQVLVACLREGGRSEVWLSHAGGRRSLDIQLSPFASDTWAAPGASYVPLYPGAAAMLWDVEHKKLIELSPGDRVLSVHGEQLLLRRDRSIWQWSPKYSQQLTAPIDELSASLRRGRLLLVPPYLFDTRSASLLGTSSGKALALSRTGHVLTAAVPSDAERLATGPFRWNAVEPVAKSVPTASAPVSADAAPPDVGSLFISPPVTTTVIQMTPAVAPAPSSAEGSGPAKPSTSVDTPPVPPPATRPSEE